MFFGLELLDLLFIAAGAIVTGFLIAVVETAWAALQAWRKGPPPAKWQVRFTDPNGIPTRTDKLSAKGVGRLLEDIDRGFYA